MFRMTILSAFLCATAAMAADVPPKTKKFADEATVANKFEIDTGKLAIKYSKSEDVKGFAQQMISDHQKAGFPSAMGLHEILEREQSGETRGSSWSRKPQKDFSA